MPWARWRASMSSSWNEPSSRRYSTRSRAVILPRLCWRSMARSEPAWSASSLRLARSSRRSVMECSDIVHPRYRGHCKQAECTLVPVEPPPSAWHFAPPPDDMDGEIVATGGDLLPGTILAAYRSGQFPMPLEGRVLAWWSPNPRGILPLDGLRVSRSLRKSCARYEVSVNTAFEDVIEACADRRRPGAWISKDVRAAYVTMHKLGWAHSVEAWDGAGRLAGGLYGLAIGGVFAGESMFHRAPDASKVALVELVRLLREGGSSLLDVQWQTPHLASLGVIEVERAEYHRRLAEALSCPLPSPFSG